MRSDWRRQPACALGRVGGGGRAALGVQPCAAAAPAPAPRRAAHQTHGAALYEMCSHTVYIHKDLLIFSSVWRLYALRCLQLSQIAMSRRSCCSSFCLAVHGLGHTKAPGE